MDGSTCKTLDRINNMYAKIGDPTRVVINSNPGMASTSSAAQSHLKRNEKENSTSTHACQGPPVKKCRKQEHAAVSASSTQVDDLVPLKDAWPGGEKAFAQLAQSQKV